jgi:hypothetical protein
VERRIGWRGRHRERATSRHPRQQGFHRNSWIVPWDRGDRTVVHEADRSWRLDVLYGFGEERKELNGEQISRMRRIRRHIRGGGPRHQQKSQLMGLSTMFVVKLVGTASITFPDTRDTGVMARRVG